MKILFQAAEWFTALTVLAGLVLSLWACVTQNPASVEAPVALLVFSAFLVVIGALPYIRKSGSSEIRWNKTALVVGMALMSYSSWYLIVQYAWDA